MPLAMWLVAAVLLMLAGTPQRADAQRADRADRAARTASDADVRRGDRGASARAADRTRAAERTAEAERTPEAERAADAERAGTTERTGDGERAGMTARTGAAERIGVTERTGAAEPVDDEIVVRGEAWEELRLEIRLAEEAVYDRFNEINSNDDFDIHCRMEPELGSRFDRRHCWSNGWRDHDADFAQATLNELLGQAGPNPAMFRTEQLVQQNQLEDELRRLVATDPALAEAVMRWGNAQRALVERSGGELGWTLFRQLVPGPDGRLPYDAARVFEVKIGREGWWIQRLAHPTFTIGQVDGRIRKLELQCDVGGGRLDYQADIEWQVPTTWEACALRVDAKRDTTFALYEFE